MDKSLNQNEENFTILPLAINVAGGGMGVVSCILLLLIRSIMLNHISIMEFRLLFVFMATLTSLNLWSVIVPKITIT